MTALFGAAWQITILVLPAWWLARGQWPRALLTATFALALAWWCSFAIGVYNPTVATLTLLAVYGAVYITVGRGPAASARQTDPGALPKVASILVFAIVLLSALVVLHAPVAGWDALTYHLEFPAQWIANGAIKRGATDWGDLSPAYYPQLAAIFYGWFFLAPGGHAAARALPFLWWLGIFVLSRAWLREGAGSETERHRADLAALVVATLPESWSGLLATGNDLALTFWFLGTAYLLRRLGSPMNARLRLETWIGVGLASGALIGTKYTGLVYLLTLLAANLAFELLWRREKSLLLENVRNHPGGIAVAFLLALPLGPAFYLLNWLQCGNPVYPAALELGPLRLPGYYPPEFLSGHEFARSTALWRHPGYLVFFGLLLLCMPRLTLAVRHGGLSKDTARAGWLALATLLSFLFVIPFHHARLMLPCVVLAAPLLGQLPEKPGRTLLWGALLAHCAIVLMRLAEHVGPLLEPALSFRELTTLTLKETLSDPLPALQMFVAFAGIALLVAAARCLPSYRWKGLITILITLTLMWIGGRPDWEMYERSERPIARDWAAADVFLQTTDRLALIGSNAPYAWRGRSQVRRVFLANARPGGLQPLHQQSRRITRRNNTWQELGPAPAAPFLGQNLAELEVDAVIVTRLPRGDWPVERRWLLDDPELRSAFPYRVTLEESEIFFRSKTFQKRGISHHDRRI
ncbi:MAG: hypothetical protein H7A22_12620 [Spirochaetales bacterium]|nr:hypothetical protein [Spirochaetales bacterium]